MKIVEIGLKTYSEVRFELGPVVVHTGGGAPIGQANPDDEGRLRWVDNNVYVHAPESKLYSFPSEYATESQIPTKLN